MTKEELDFIGSLNMCDEISNEAYKKIMCHCEEQEPCEDCISRNDAIDVLENKERIDVLNPMSIFESGERLKAIRLIQDLPSVQPKTGWIPVSERKAEFPCIATDEYGNYPFIPSGVVEIDGCCYDGENFNFNVEEFLKGEEVILDGEKAYMPPRKIIAWMPLPEPYKEG